MKWVGYSLSLALVLVACGCAHSRRPTSRFISGRPPEYRVESLLPAESPGGVAAAVRRSEEKEAGPARPKVATLEAEDSVLKDSLARLAQDPSPQRHRVVAEAYLRAGVLDLAADHYSAAIALEPRDAASYEMRARIWRDWGFAPLGLADAHRAVFYAPGSPAARNTLGTLFHRLGQYTNARAQYQRALEIEAGAPYALVNLCALDLAEKRYQQALHSCRNAVASAPWSDLARSQLQQVRSLTDPVLSEASHGRD